MSTGARAALGAALLVVAVVLFVVLSGGDDGGDTSDGADTTAAQAPRQQQQPKPKPKPAPPPVPTITVKNGAPVGGPRTLEFDSGEKVRFRVRSNAPDEIHVHGYDITKDVPAGRPVTVSFDASLEGIFEVELHESGEQIAELQVGP